MHKRTIKEQIFCCALIRCSILLIVRRRRRVFWQKFFILEVFFAVLFSCHIGYSVPQHKPNFLLSYEALKDYAQGVLKDQLELATTDWLNQYGTVRLFSQLGDEAFFSHAEADVLLPLKDGKKSLFFVQGNYREVYGQPQTLNLGLGSRFIIKSSILGLNIFFDRSLTDEHYRLGNGFEWWQNHLKLNFNTYLPLSGWVKDPSSGQLVRPATGFDVHVNAYLPDHPQFGIELAYEYYLGKLSPTSDAENHSFLKLGLNYTPIPLLTFNIDYKTKKETQDRVSVGMALTYRLGVPLRAQFDSEFIGKLRSVSHTRYDFVARNREIILQYRKKALFRFQSNLTAPGNTEQYLFEDSVKEQNWYVKEWAGTDGIVGNLSDECQHSQELESCRLRMPNYQSQGDNKYELYFTLENDQTKEEYKVKFNIKVAPNVWQKVKIESDRSQLIFNSGDKSTESTKLRLKLLTEEGESIQNNEMPAKDFCLKIFHKDQVIKTVKLTKAPTYYEGSFSLTDLEQVEETIYHIQAYYRDFLIKDVSYELASLDGNKLPDRTFSFFKIPKYFWLTDKPTTQTFGVYLVNRKQQDLVFLEEDWQFILRDEKGKIVQEAAEIRFIPQGNDKMGLYDFHPLKAGHYKIALLPRDSKSQNSNDDILVKEITILQKAEDGCDVEKDYEIWMHPKEQSIVLDGEEKDAIKIQIVVIKSPSLKFDVNKLAVTVTNAKDRVIEILSMKEDSRNSYYVKFWPLRKLGYQEGSYKLNLTYGGKPLKEEPKWIEVIESPIRAIYEKPR